MGDEHETPAFAPLQVEQDVPELGLGHGVEHGRGLVGDEVARTRRKRAHHGEAHELAARELVGQAREPLVSHAKSAPKALELAIAGGRLREALVHAHARVKGLLGMLPEQLDGARLPMQARDGRERCAVDAHGARRGLEVAGEQAAERRLAGAGRCLEGDALSRANREVEAMEERPAAGIGKREPARLEDSAHGRCAALPACRVHAVGTAGPMGSARDGGVARPSPEDAACLPVIRERGDDGGLGALLARGKVVPWQGVPELAREGMAQQLRRGEALACGLLHHRSVAEDCHAVARAQGKLDVMRDEQDAPTRIGKRAQVVEGVYRQVEVEAGRGLVGHDEARLVHEGAHEQHTARHAARELVRIEALDLRREAVGGKELALAGSSATGVGLALGSRGTPGDAANLLSHAHERVEVVHALGHERDAVAAQGLERLGRLGLAVEPDAASYLGVWLEQAEQGIGQHGLARTGGAHHGQNLARVDGEGEAVEHLAADTPGAEERRGGVVHVEGHGEVLDREQVVATGMVRERRVRVVVMELVAMGGGGGATRALLGDWRLGRTRKQPDCVCGRMACACD